MAATKQKIFKRCTQCVGTGLMAITQTTPEVGDPETGTTTAECNNCEGKGHIYWGYLRIPETPENE